LTDLLDRLRSTLGERYAIERQIGEGGMAIVYRAKDLKHERTVAIKVLRQELAVSLGADRFLREIRVAANLQHPTSSVSTTRARWMGCCTTSCRSSRANRSATG
jgi:eukaryotic-like serine/threonine-protein kinase